MSNQIHHIEMSESFSWTATQDCWVFVICDTNKSSGYASQVKLNGAGVVSVLNGTTSYSIQSSGFFPCKQGDIISKLQHHGTLASMMVYGVR